MSQIMTDEQNKGHQIQNIGSFSGIMIDELKKKKSSITIFMNFLLLEIGIFSLLGYTTFLNTTLFR